jgi:hypothetical protein
LSGDKPPRVLALTPDGRRNDAFGEDGIAVVDLRALRGVREAHLAVRSDGSVAVTGQFTRSGEPYLAMLTAGGAIDTTFGDGGLVVDYPSGEPLGIVIDSQDRVVTANRGFVVRFEA